MRREAAPPDPVRLPLQRDGWPPFLAPGTLRVWPIEGAEAPLEVAPFAGPQSMALGARREPGRCSAGVDVRARVGDTVVSPISGHVLRRGAWWRGTDAIWIRQQRIVVCLGGIAADPDGPSSGDDVASGHRVGRVCRPSMATTCLHLEAYDAQGDTDEQFVERIKHGELRWYRYDVPERLLDPTIDMLVLSYVGAHLRRHAPRVGPIDGGVP